MEGGQRNYKGPGRVIEIGEVLGGGVIGVLEGLEGGQRDYKGPGRVIEMDWGGPGGVIGF